LLLVGEAIIQLMAPDMTASCVTPVGQSRSGGREAFSGLVWETEERLKKVEKDQNYCRRNHFCKVRKADGQRAKEGHSTDSPQHPKRAGGAFAAGRRGKREKSGGEWEAFRVDGNEIKPGRKSDQQSALNSREGGAKG